MAHRDPSKLTAKEEKFCQEYLVDLNATQAAIRAGYTTASIGATHVQACKLMKVPRIKARVQELMNERAARTEITADYVLNTIKDTIERCRQAEKVMEFDHDAKEMVHTGEWQFEYQGVLKGCELLGKHLKLFTERVEHSGKVSLEEIVAGADEGNKDGEN